MEAMQKMEEQMRDLLEKHPEENSIAYDYYSVLAAMESAQLEKAEKPSDSLRDAMFMNFKKALEFQEKMSVEEKSRRNLQPVWNYYNIAVQYDLMFDPPLSDSTRKYLDKAAECFLSGMLTHAIADIFHVEPASVYTVRYRLKKKLKIT